MQTLITICARAGSKGLPHKNILPFNGRPLIEWTIIQALSWRDEIPIIISSDDSGVEKIFHYWMATNLYFDERPEELARDDTPKLDVLRHVLEKTEMSLDRKFDLLIDLDPTNPLRTQKDLDNCLEIFEKKQPKTLISVTKAKKNPYFNQIEWDRDEDRFFNVEYTIVPDFIRRQDCPDVYDVNSSIYFYNTDWLKEGHNTPLSDKTEIYEMAEWTRCDIDSEYDFFVAEKTMEKYL